MIKAVIFDLDGTLFDRDTSVRRLVEAQYEVYAAALAHVPKVAFVTRFVELDARGYVKKDEVYTQLVAEFAIRDIHATALFDDFVARYHHHCIPFLGLKEMLAELQGQGLRLGIITNGDATFQLRTIRALGIESYFTAILVSEIEGIKKPDAALFQRALSRLGVAANESVFVGDHPLVDIAGARSAGLKAIWKRDEYWEPPLEVDGVIADLSELAASIRAK